MGDILASFLSLFVAACTQGGSAKNVAAVSRTAAQDAGAEAKIAVSGAAASAGAELKKTGSTIVQEGRKISGD
ncbi:MAG: hypothetical protein ACRED9_14915 [Caulobacteraceae bacterium]